jgi:uncharacterized protein (TIGR02246 family)
MRQAAMALAAALAVVPVLHAAGPSTEARLQRLEDREQINELLVAYGATLDRHDFAAFGQLFAEDADYAAGPGAPTHGRAAIQAQLEKTITANPSNLPPPNFHISFNPSIRIEGDRASVRSLGAYVAPDPATKTTRMVFFVVYQDEMIRKDGRWLFQRRAISSGAPPAPAR